MKPLINTHANAVTGLTSYWYRSESAAVEHLEATPLASLGTYTAIAPLKTSTSPGIWRVDVRE